MQDFGIIVNMVATIIAALQLFSSHTKNKYFDFPFLEYDGEKERQIVIMAANRWRISLIALMLIWIINTIANMYEVDEISFLCFKSVIYFNLAIMVIPVVVKDVFHNVIIWKQYFINFYKKHMPTKICLDIIFGIDAIVMLITISMILYTDNEKDKMIAYFALAVLIAASFCIYRIISEVEELLCSHAVKALSLKTTDGKIYEQIDTYVEKKNVIYIKVNNNEVFYLPKDQIVFIKKEVSESNLMEDTQNLVMNIEKNYKKKCL